MRHAIRLPYNSGLHVNEVHARGATCRFEHNNVAGLQVTEPQTSTVPCQQRLHAEHKKSQMRCNPTTKLHSEVGCVCVGDQRQAPLTARSTGTHTPEQHIHPGRR